MSINDNYISILIGIVCFLIILFTVMKCVITSLKKINKSLSDKLTESDNKILELQKANDKLLSTFYDKLQEVQKSTVRIEDEFKISLQDFVSWQAQISHDLDESNNKLNEQISSNKMLLDLINKLKSNNISTSESYVESEVFNEILKRQDDIISYFQSYNANLSNLKECLEKDLAESSKTEKDSFVTKSGKFISGCNTALNVLHIIRVLSGDITAIGDIQM